MDYVFISIFTRMLKRLPSTHQGVMKRMHRNTLFAI